jgi:hypothetical protein
VLLSLALLHVIYSLIYSFHIIYSLTAFLQHYSFSVDVISSLTSWLSRPDRSPF